MNKTAIAGLLLVLTGCAPTVYYKDGATAHDFNRALASCRVEAAMVPHTNDGLFDAVIGRQTIRNCLIAQDWEPKS